MLSPDMFDRNYTAEILRARGRDVNKILEIIKRHTTGYRPPHLVNGGGDIPIEIHHSFVTSSKVYHRTVRTLETPDRGTITVPRTQRMRGKEYYLYDVLLACRDRDVVVAVPFHGLAEEFFVQVDRALSGQGAVYEKLDITTMVINLGKEGLAEVSSADSTGKLQIGLTRCSLAYSDPKNRNRNLVQISMSGAQIGASEEYQYLIRPVLEPNGNGLVVTPILVGISLFSDHIKKTSLITDRHGNFKLWVGQGATRIERIFSLLKGIDTIKGIISTTINLPILQSRTIRGTEGD